MAIDISHTGQKISWFKDRLAEERLVFKPPFQRNPVWQDKHKAYLVDTVLRNLPIPEIYIQTDTDAEGKTTYSIVDGQQRVRALLGFAKNEFALMEAFSPGRDGDTWEGLSEDEKKKYWGYELVVREISAATDADLRDLFQRLNQNTVTLNAQEIRNARYKGEFINAVTELANQDYWAEQRIVTANEIRRMLDIEFMAELLVGLMHGPQNKKAALDGMFSSYETSFPDKIKWVSKFENTRSFIARALPDIKDTRWRGKSDYYSLFLAVGEVSEGKSTLKKAAGKELIEFGAAVTARLSKEGLGRPSKGVRDYATAVEKAASDKDRRETRHQILKSLLAPHFS